MAECWSENRIEAAARSADPDAGHLRDCDSCRERLARARDEQARIAELRSARRRLPDARPDDALVPGYRIEAEIHRGGQGIVYRAVQETTRRDVALKILLAGTSATARERRRFEREIELASRLDHPGIVRLYDSGVADGTPWCAMERIEGLRLDEWVASAAPGLRAKLEVARLLCAAVAHAHQRGVIHRDLKPANVLVDAEGRPHVLDFGTALAELDASRGPRVTAPGEFLGTLAYAAPEQLRGAPHAIDTRTDVYALGVVVYELVTGRLPFEVSGGLAEIAGRVTSERVAPPSSFAGGIDRDLDAMLLKALATDPPDRYGSAEAFENDLARYLADEPIEARRQSLLYVIRKRLARRRRSVLAAAALAVAGGAMGFAWLREHQRAEYQANQAALVRSIVHDLMAAPAPDRMGGDARMLDVYEVVARDLDAALESAPDVQAEVELTIGDTYRRLLRTAEAEPHLRRALERLREIDAGDGLAVARACDALALVLADLNRPEAIAVASEALAIRERELPAGDVRIAESRRTLAQAHLQQFQGVDFERARALLDQALTDLRAAHGDEHPDVAEIRLLQASILEHESSREAGELLHSALATLERVAPRDPRALGALTLYAAFLQKEGRYDAARELLDRAGLLARSLFGDALASDLLRRHARLEFARGNFRSAELLSRQAVARELERWAALKADLRDDLRALARRLEQPGPPAAEPPFAEAFARLRALEGDGAFELAQWMNGIALVLRELERGAATIPILREALNIRCRAMGPDCPHRRRTIELLASELAAEHRGGEAVDLLEEAVATWERVNEVASPAAERTRELLATCRVQASEPRGR